MKGTQGFTNKDHLVIKKVMIGFLISKSTLCFNRSFEQCVYLFELVSQVIKVAYGPLVFSSPEPNAQVSFSDQNSSIVCRRWHVVVVVVVVNFSHFHLLLRNH